MLFIIIKNLHLIINYKYFTILNIFYNDIKNILFAGNIIVVFCDSQNVSADIVSHPAVQHRKLLIFFNIKIADIYKLSF